MNTIHVFIARLSALLFVLLFSATAFGGVTKVELCHTPPDNPDNAHTISVSDKAYDTHMNHGDIDGACEDVPPIDPDECSCFVPQDLVLLEDGTTPACFTQLDGNGDLVDIIGLYQGFTVCAGDGTLGCVEPTAPSFGCLLTDNSTGPIEKFDDLNAAKNANCKKYVFDSCFPPPPTSP